MLTVYDVNTLLPPSDFEKVGSINVFVEVSRYDLETNQMIYEQVKVEMHPCTMSDAAMWPSKIEDYVSEEFISDYYCPDSGQKAIIWQKDDYQEASLKIQIDSCKGVHCLQDA